MSAIQIYCLGSGDAFSAGGRHHAAYLMQHSKGALLLDCGPSTLAALKSWGLRPGSIDAILLSHFHGDHFGGLPFLFLQYTYIELRRRALKIVGPPSVQSKVMNLYKAMYADSAAEPFPYPVEFIEIEPNRSLLLDGIEVHAFEAPHQINPVSLGYEILTNGRKIVYSGDSGWTEELIVRTKDADLLLCECSFFHSRYATHIDYVRIAENLPRLGAKRIILTHLGQEVLERCAELALETAYDGLVITI